MITLELADVEIDHCVGCGGIWLDRGELARASDPSVALEVGSGKVELPGGVSIHLSRVGPGVFLSLFGATILGLSFHYGVAVDVPAATTSAQVASAADSAAAPAARATFSGIGAGGRREPDPAQDVHAADVHVERLNRAAAALDPSLDRYARGDIERTLRSAKLALMRASWSESRWGERAAFSAWIDAGEPMPPPQGIATAVAIYRAGL